MGTSLDICLLLIRIHSPLCCFALTIESQGMQQRAKPSPGVPGWAPPSSNRGISVSLTLVSLMFNCSCHHCFREAWEESSFTEHRLLPFSSVPNHKTYALFSKALILCSAPYVQCVVFPPENSGEMVVLGGAFSQLVHSSLMMDGLSFDVKRSPVFSARQRWYQDSLLEGWSDTNVSFDKERTGMLLQKASYFNAIISRKLTDSSNNHLHSYIFTTNNVGSINVLDIHGYAL